jgi:hypothetical protein
MELILLAGNGSVFADMLYSCDFFLCFTPSWHGLQRDCQLALSQNSVISSRCEAIRLTTAAGLIPPSTSNKRLIGDGLGIRFWRAAACARTALGAGLLAVAP